MTGPLLWRRIRMHFGISAPRMTVRTALPWWERGAVLAGVIATVAAVGWWVLSASHSSAAPRAADGDPRVTALGSEASRLREDVGRLRMRSSQLESDLVISRSAQEALLRQVAELTAENAKLKEDTTMLRKLLADAAQAGPKGTAASQRP